MHYITSKFVLSQFFLIFFSYIATATTEIYTLSLHDALPIRNGETASKFRAVLAELDLPADSPIHYEQGNRQEDLDRKSTRLNSSHVSISYAVFCLKKKKS